MCSWAMPRLFFAVTRCVPFEFRSDVDLVELDVREVVRLDRLLEVRVHLADLGEDRLRLRALRLIDGSAVAAPVPTTRATARPASADDEEGACRFVECFKPLAFGERQGRRVGSRRPQVGEPSSRIRRLHARTVAQKLCKQRGFVCYGLRPVRRRARYLAPCVAALLLGSASRGSPSARRERPALGRVSPRRAVGRARALRERVGPRPRRSDDVTRLDARRLEPRAVARADARTRATVVRALARRDPPEHRHAPPPPVRRRRGRSDRRPLRRALARRRARGNRRARARDGAEPAARGRGARAGRPAARAARAARARRRSQLDASQRRAHGAAAESAQPRRSRRSGARSPRSAASRVSPASAWPPPRSGRGRRSAPRRGSRADARPHARHRDAVTSSAACRRAAPQPQPARRRPSGGRLARRRRRRLPPARPHRERPAGRASA